MIKLIGITLRAVVFRRIVMNLKLYFGFWGGTFLFVSNAIFAQGTIDPEWLIKRISPASNREAQAWAVDVDDSGNVYWATNQVYPGQGLDVVLYKLDADSNEIWFSPTIYGGPFSQQSYIVKVVGDRAYIAGRDCPGLLSSCDMLIVAVDIFAGDTLWSTVWDQGYGYEEVDGIMVGDDGIYITGWTTGDTTGLDIALLKLDLNGNIIQTNTWGSNLHDHQDGHAVMDDSVIYVAGLYECPYTFPDFRNDLDGKSLIAKFSRYNLSYLDHIVFGRNDPWQNRENAQGMISDGTFLYVVGVTTPSIGNWDIFVAKFDKNLNQLWYNLWGGDYVEMGRAITIADNGNIYVGCNTKSFGAGDQDVALLSYSPNGNFLGYQTWGGTEEDATRDIRADGNYLYLTGESKSLHLINDAAAYLMKVNIDSIVTSIHYDPLLSDFCLDQNYPNPFNPATTIEYNLSRATHVTLRIYNLLGQEVRTLVDKVEQPGIYQTKWDGTNDTGLPVVSGVYVYQLYSDSGVQTRKMTLMQ